MAMIWILWPKWGKRSLLCLALCLALNWFGDDVETVAWSVDLHNGRAASDLVLRTRPVAPQRKVPPMSQPTAEVSAPTDGQVAALQGDHDANHLAVGQER